MCGAVIFYKFSLQLLTRKEDEKLRVQERKILIRMLETKMNHKVLEKQDGTEIEMV